MAAASSSRITPEMAGKAVDALLKWIKSKAKNQKAQLLEHDEFLYLILTLKKIPSNSRTNPYKILLPHSFHSFDGSEEICLIIDDRSKGAVSLSSDVAKKKIASESIPISKVLKLSKLKSDYRPFEAKRQLCGSYDLFFADKRIIPSLPRLLGKQFFKKKKIPVPVDLTHKNWKEQIKNACDSALFYLRTGTCSVIKVGRVSQGRDQLVENVITVVEGVADVVPKKWANIRSFHLKSLESLALPIYQAVPEMGLKIEGFKKEEEGEKPKDQLVMKTDSEVKEGKKRKVPKKGRIHEVRYMDTSVEKSMEELVADDEDDVGGGKDNGNVGELKNKKKIKKAELVAEAEEDVDDECEEDNGNVGELKKKKKKKKKTAELVAEGEEDVEDEGGEDNGNVGELKKKKKKKAELVAKGEEDVEGGEDSGNVGEVKKKKKKKKKAATQDKEQVLDELNGKKVKNSVKAKRGESSGQGVDGIKEKKKKVDKSGENEKAKKKEKRTKQSA